MNMYGISDVLLAFYPRGCYRNQFIELYLRSTIDTVRTIILSKWIHDDLKDDRLRYSDFVSFSFVSLKKQILVSLAINGLHSDLIVITVS